MIKHLFSHSKPLSFRQITASAMHTASVTRWGQAPVYTEIESPPVPPSGGSETQVKVVAAGLHRVVRSRATGQHYSSQSLPHVPGTDGVGFDLEGRAVYFSTFATGGSFCDIVNVPKSACTPLPDGVDPIQAAALINPALSSWMAMTQRTNNLPDKFSVLILGVTSASGKIAISLARALGAERIIGCARNPETMSKLNLDDTIVLQPKIEETDFSLAGNVDVILDYIYGPTTEHLLRSVKFGRQAVQYVHIGSVSGSVDIALPGSVLRSKNLTIRGSGPGSWSHESAAKEMPRLLDAFRGLEKRNVRQVALSEVEKAWDMTDERVVFLP